MAGPIDVHTHIIAPELLDFILRYGDRLATRVADENGRKWLVIQESARRPLTPRLTDLQTRIAEMDQQGIQMQALSCPPFVMYYDADADVVAEAAQVVNGTVVSAAERFPERFVPVANVALQDPQAAIAELERVAKRGARAVQIGSHVRGEGLDSPTLLDFFARAAELELPVIIHPFDAAPTGRLQRYYLGNLYGNPTETGLAAALLIYGGVLEALPRLKVLLLHAAGVFPMVLGRLDHGHRVRPECQQAIPRPPSDYLPQLWADTIAHDAETLRFTLDRIGAERVVLGSDYPFDMGLADPIKAIRDVPGLREAERAAVLESNARRLLRLD